LSQKLFSHSKPTGGQHRQSSVFVKSAGQVNKEQSLKFNL
jgi:hypothetical protein